MLTNYNLDMETKEARLILQPGSYIYFNKLNISGGTAFLLRGLIYIDKGKLRRYNFETRNSVQYDTIRTCKSLNKKKVNIEIM